LNLYPANQARQTASPIYKMSLCKWFHKPQEAGA